MMFAGVVAVEVTAHRTFLSGSRVYGKAPPVTHFCQQGFHFPDVSQPSKAVLQAENQVFKNKWVVVV